MSRSHAEAVAGQTLPHSRRTIPAALAFWTERTPDAPALRSLDGRQASYRELHDAVVTIAARLAARGLGRQDRVAVVLPSGFDACVAVLGVMTAAIAVPLSPALTVPELRRDLARLDPRLLVTDGAHAAAGRVVAAELSIATVDGTDLVAPCKRRAQDVSFRAAARNLGALPGRDEPRDPSRVGMTPAAFDAVGAELAVPQSEDTAAILHTSGSTALPKRVLRSHRSFVAGARAARGCNALTPDDVLLLIPGLHSNMGLTNLCAALCSGGCCVATTGFDPDAFPEWLDVHRPTWTVTTVTELELILAAAAKPGRSAVVGPHSRLRIHRVGAQPKTPGMVERAEAGLRALVFDGYGMTEATYITASGPDPESRRAGACGRSWGTEIRVLDTDGEDVPVGAVGEVALRGETLFSGYLDDPQANAAAFLPGGWFRTGDLGSLSADGYLSLIGRLNEQINRGGEKIAPAEVDHALLSHPAIADAACFAVPDPRLGEDIVAAVVFRPETCHSARSLRRWLLGRLAPHKVPRRIWEVSSLPRTANGKVQRGELTRRWREEPG